MVDSTIKTVTKQIDTTTSTGLGIKPSTDSEPKATNENFREIRRTIVEDANDSQITAKEQRETDKEQRVTNELLFH